MHTPFGAPIGADTLTKIELRRETTESERRLVLRKLERMEKMFEWAKIPQFDDDNITNDQLKAVYNRYLLQIRETFKTKFTLLKEQYGDEVEIEYPDYTQPLEITNDRHNETLKLIAIKKTLKKREIMLVGVLSGLQGILSKVGLPMNGFIIQQMTDISSYRPFLSQGIDPNVSSELVPSTWSYQLQIAGLVGINAVIYFAINYMCGKIPYIGTAANGGANPQIRQFSQQLQAELRNFMFGDTINESGTEANKASVINDVINLISTGDYSGILNRFTGGGGGIGDIFAGMMGGAAAGGGGGATAAAAAAGEAADTSPPRPAGRKRHK